MIALVVPVTLVQDAVSYDPARLYATLAIMFVFVGAAVTFVRLRYPGRLIAEIAAWEHPRNATGARVRWMFTTERVRTKLARTYPHIAKES